MVAYARVVPRDLFNEANLLKCLGQLWIELHNQPRHDAWMSEGDGSSFKIEQDPSDGSISVRSLPFRVNGNIWILRRPLNSRRPWPLYANRHDEEVEVFTEEGTLTAAFLQLVGVFAEVDDEGYPPACSNPRGHSWVIQTDVEGEGRSYCEFCGADGDA